MHVDVGRQKKKTDGGELAFFVVNHPSGLHLLYFLDQEVGCKYNWVYIYDMGVSKNRGTPKWIVYSGNPY